MTAERPSPNLRILTLCYEFPPLGGGGSKVAHGLAASLAGQGHEVDLVTTRYADHAPRETVDGIRVERVPAWRRRADRSNALELATYVLPCFWRARRLCGDRPPDVVHAHFIFPDGVACWLLKLWSGRRYIITAHGSDVPGYNPDRFQLAHSLLGPLWRRVVANADAIICPSPWLRDLLREKSAGAKLLVIPNGFDPSRFARPAETGDGPREHSDEILCVSRLMERKGLQHLLRAVGRLKRRPKVRIVGVGAYEPELRAIAGELGLDVVFHGWVDNDDPALAELFARAGIFVLPSSTENFPVSLLEAMSAGLAIVTTAKSGCEDVVGDAAILTPYGDIEAITTALERLVDDADLRRTLGDRARQRLLDRFAWPAVTREYLRAYERYPSEPHRPRTAAAGSIRARRAATERSTGPGDTR